MTKVMGVLLTNCTHERTKDRTYTKVLAVFLPFDFPDIVVMELIGTLRVHLSESGMKGSVSKATQVRVHFCQESSDFITSKAHL